MIDLKLMSEEEAAEYSRLVAARRKAGTPSPYDGMEYTPDGPGQLWEVHKDGRVSFLGYARQVARETHAAEEAAPPEDDNALPLGA